MTRADLGTLGGASSYATDIDDRGMIVGWSETADGESHAFRWTAATGMIDLGTLPGDRNSQAIAISRGGTLDGGQIIGISGGSSYDWRPVAWSASGTIQALPIPLLPGAFFSWPTGLNPRGQVIGWDSYLVQHAWVWSAAVGKYDLSAHAPITVSEGAATAISPSGVILLTLSPGGCRHGGTCWRGYEWSDKMGYMPMGTPPGLADDDNDVTAVAMNDGGRVVGVAWGFGPYRWDAKTGYTRLAGDGYPYGINSRSTIVGDAAFRSITGVQAAAWPPSGGVVRLSPEDPNPSIAIAINESGQIAGWAVVADGVNHAVMWSDNPNIPGFRHGTVPSYRAPEASMRCLTDAASSSSKQALFACIAEADHDR